MNAVDKVFKLTIILKGIHAFIEIFLGITLLVLTKEAISNGIAAFVEGRLAGDPSGFIAQHILQFGIDFSVGIKLFLAFYLCSHGIVNISMVYGIIKRPSYAYPISIVLFIGFMFYEANSYLLTSSLWLLMLTLFDILFLSLLFYEYDSHLKRYSFLGKLRLIVKADLPKIVEIELPKIRIIK